MSRPQVVIDRHENGAVDNCACRQGPTATKTNREVQIPVISPDGTTEVITLTPGDSPLDHGLILIDMCSEWDPEYVATQAELQARLFGAQSSLLPDDVESPKRPKAVQLEPLDRFITPSTDASSRDSSTSLGSKLLRRRLAAKLADRTSPLETALAGS